MFAIYNINGRAFRNSLEQLKKVHPTHASQSVESQQDTSQDETIVIQGSGTEGLSNAKSIAAYREMLHLNERIQITHAYQIMTHPVYSLINTTSVGEALKDFEHHQVQQMPVITPQHNLVGLITSRQLLHAELDPNISLDTPIANIMHQDVISADPISDIRRVARALYEYQLSAIPIVNEQDQLVGIISKTDLLKAIMMDPPLSLWS